MSNYEYAQATQEQLDAWLEAAYQVWLDEQTEKYEEKVCAWYAARGLHNVY